MIRSLCIGLAMVLLVAACQTQRSSVVSGGSVSGGSSASPVAARPSNSLFPDIPASTLPHPPGSCLTDDEIRADQFMLLKTQMMLAGLTCTGPYNDGNTFGHYQDFILTHASTIRDAQNTMARFLSRYRSGNPNRLFDTYATSYSNNEAQVMNQVSGGRYCQALQNRFYSASSFSAAEMQSFLNQALEQTRSRYQVCG